MILCCGEALIDMLPRKSAAGEDAYAPHVGGAVFNTAIALGRLGAPAAFFSGISTDLFGRRRRADQCPRQVALIAASTRAGVIGSWRSRAPVRSNTAFASTAPIGTTDGSPPPCGARSDLTITASSFGIHEKRGNW